MSLRHRKLTIEVEIEIIIEAIRNIISFACWVIFLDFYRTSKFTFSQNSFRNTIDVKKLVNIIRESHNTDRIPTHGTARERHRTLIATRQQQEIKVKQSGIVFDRF